MPFEPRSLSGLPDAGPCGGIQILFRFAPPIAHSQPTSSGVNDGDDVASNRGHLARTLGDRRTDRRARTPPPGTRVVVRERADATEVPSTHETTGPYSTSRYRIAFCATTPPPVRQKATNPRWPVGNRLVAPTRCGTSSTFIPSRSAFK